MHDYWPFAVTIAVILAGILFNRQDLSRIEARLDRMEADLREFYRTLGDHGARIENMEKK